MHRFLAIALVALVLACQKPASTEARTPPGDSSAPVARFTGGVVTAGELEAAVFETKKQALDQLLMRKLVEAKAKAEGITPEALFKREVQDKIKPPSDAEMKAFYDEQKGRNPQLPPFEQLKDQVAQYLSRGGQQKAQQEFIEKLRADAKVEILLAPPRVKVAAEGPSRGPDKAAVTIVEFSDFECPYCVKAEETVKEVMKAYDGKVRLVYRDFPLPFHPHAQKAAEAAHCAGDQGKYWDMHGKLFANQQKLGEGDLKDHAKGLGLDAAKFEKCLSSGEKAALIEASKKAGSEVGVTGTPAFFINGVMISGAQPFSEFKSVIDRELARN
jgi:protein-disulfide isomerase